MPTATEDITDATTRDFLPQADLPSAPRARKGGHDSIRSNGSLDADPLTLSLESSSQANGTVGNNHHHPAHSPSSSSSSQLSGCFAEDDDDYGNDGGRYGRNRGASSQSSISSLPGSVVVYPLGKSHTLPFLAHDDDTYADSRHHKGRMPAKFAPRVRDRNSPFRHPSSVRAMQMGDEEEDYEKGDEDMEWGTLTSSSKRRWRQEKAFAQSPSFSEMSVDSQRTGRGSPFLHRQHRSSPRRMTPQQQPQEQAPKEYPLILLHCTLLPPSLSLPPGLGTPSTQLLKDALPPQYWQRWKLLEDKIVGSGVLRDRGVLISHPQDAYDLLEERLLESLELVRPRLANGHFLGRKDEDTNETGHRDDEDAEEANGINGHTCADCGKAVDGGERKWDVRVYAANGLMRAGAWEAAWREMEKVDVEVGICLPADVRQDLERRILGENEARLEVERQMADEETRRREVYGEAMGPSQDDIDGLVDDENDELPCPPDPPTGSAHHETESRVESPDIQGPPREVDLRVALLNYIRLLARDPRNAALIFMAVLIAFLAIQTAKPDLSSDLTTPPNIPLHSSSFSSLEQHEPPIATVASAFTSSSPPSPVASSGDSEPSTQAAFPSSSSARKAEPIKPSSSSPSPSSHATETSQVPLPHASEPQPSGGLEDVSTAEAAEPESTIGTTPFSPLIRGFEKETLIPPDEV